MDFSDIPPEELGPLYAGGPAANDLETFRQDLLAQFAANGLQLRGPTSAAMQPGQFGATPVAQLLSALAASNSDNPLDALTTLADKLGAAGAVQGAPAGLGSNDGKRQHHRLLWDAHHPKRITFLLLLGIFVRLLLPLLPVGYAVSFFL